MKLKEYQAKKLFKQYGIPIPKGKLITPTTPIESQSQMLAKAQVLEGGRAKKGLIRPTTRENLKKLFGYCSEILLEEKLKIKKEYYLALAIDREEKDIIVLFSSRGGIDIEKSPKITKIPLSVILKKNPLPQKFLPLIKSMYRLMKDQQALLVEINPLALTEKGLVAADAKIILDDNALALTKASTNQNLNYIPLKGNLAVIGNGAGLVMATLDLIHHLGGKPANFLDLGGGASEEKIENALKLVASQKPKAILINIFGGITRADLIAQALVNCHRNLPAPLFVRLTGTNEKKAKQILSQIKIKTYPSMEQVIKTAVGYVHSR